MIPCIQLVVQLYTRCIILRMSALSSVPVHQPATHLLRGGDLAARPPYRSSAKPYRSSGAPYRSSGYRSSG